MAHGSYGSRSALALEEGDHRSKTLGIVSCCRASLKRSNFVAVAKDCTHRRRLSRGPRVFDEAGTGSALLCLWPSKSSRQWEDLRFFLAVPFCPTVQECQTSFSSLFISCHDCQQRSKLGLPKHSFIGRSSGIVMDATCPSHRGPFPSSDMTTRQTPARNRNPFACSVHRRLLLRPGAWTLCPGTCILPHTIVRYNIQQHTTSSTASILKDTPDGCTTASTLPCATCTILLLGLHFTRHCCLGKQHADSRWGHTVRLP